VLACLLACLHAGLAILLNKYCRRGKSQFSDLSLCNSYMLGDGKGQNREAYDKGYSQAVTHPSNNPARQSLT